MQVSLKIIGKITLLLLMAGLLFIKGIMPAWKEVHSDFANYYVSARLIVDGVSFEQVYDNSWFQEKIREYGINTPGKFSPFPPMTAFVLVPLTPLDPITAQRFFVIVNLLFVALGLIVIRRLIQWSVLDCGLLVLSSGLGLINNIGFGQVYWIMTVLILLALYWADRGNYFISGVTLGVLAMLKYFPIVFIAGFFLDSVERMRPKWNFPTRIVAHAIGTILLLIIFQILFFGKTVMTEFVQNVFLYHLDGELSGQGSFSFRFQSWDSFFRNLFVFDSEFNRSPLFNWESGRLISKIIIALSMITSLGLVLRKAFQLKKEVKVSIILTTLSLAALVMLPASATYHFILLLIPIALIIKDDLVERKILMAILGINFLIGIIPYEFAFQLSQRWGIIFALPRLWLVTALYIVALVGINTQIDNLLAYKKL